MSFKDGIFIDKDTKYGIILEKPLAMEYSFKILSTLKGVNSLEKIKNPFWGSELICLNYFDASITLLNAQGSPNAINAVERLKRMGVNYLVSIGTCGSLDESIETGTFIFSTGAVREEGATDRYLPLSVPSLSHFNLTCVLKNEIDSLGVKSLLGVTYTTDTRYREDQEELGLLFKHANVLNIDMETAAILLTSTYYKIPVSAINIVTDCAVKHANSCFKDVTLDHKDYENFMHEHLSYALKATLSMFHKIETNKIRIY